MFNLNPALRDFWATKSIYKLLKGGRYSSKTHDAAGFVTYIAHNYRVRVACLRYFRNRNADSTYTTLLRKIRDAGWMDEFEISSNYIRNKKTGSEFIFYGVARNIEEIKGIENIDIAWYEEANKLTKQQFLVINNTIRKEGSEFWATWNPAYITDFIERDIYTQLGSDYIVRHINYDENPYLSDTARKKAESLKTGDPESYEWHILGIPRAQTGDAYIDYRWIEASINAHLKLGIDLRGAYNTGYDVADSGDDKNATVRFCGGVCENTDIWSGGEDNLTQSARRAWSNAEGGVLMYDSIGVGAHTGSTLKDMGVRGDKFYKFNAGERVAFPDDYYSWTDMKNKEMFENLKAQAWTSVADRFRNTYNAIIFGEDFAPEDLISISSTVENLEQLKVELATPKKQISKRGLQIVESKDSLKKRGIKSPNLADAFIIGACPHLRETEQSPVGLFY